jgi:hypothetical protein
MAAVVCRDLVERREGDSLAPRLWHPEGHLVDLLDDLADAWTTRHFDARPLDRAAADEIQLFVDPVDPQPRVAARRLPV